MVVEIIINPFRFAGFLARRFETFIGSRWSERVGSDHGLTIQEQPRSLYNPVAIVVGTVRRYEALFKAVLSACGNFVKAAIDNVPRDSIRSWMRSSRSELRAAHRYFSVDFGRSE